MFSHVYGLIVCSTVEKDKEHHCLMSTSTSSSCTHVANEIVGTLPFTHCIRISRIVQVDYPNSMSIVRILSRTSEANVHRAIIYILKAIAKRPKQPSHRISSNHHATDLTERTSAGDIKPE
jgi:hypothetical protein